MITTENETKIHEIQKRISEKYEVEMSKSEIINQILGQKTGQEWIEGWKT